MLIFEISGGGVDFVFKGIGGIGDVDVEGSVDMGKY